MTISPIADEAERRRVTGWPHGPRPRWVAVFWAAVTALLLVVPVSGLILMGCPKPGPGPNRPDASDAAPPPIDPDFPPSAACDDVCANVKRLGCPGAKACAGICSRIHGRAYKSCAASATSCDAINRCDQGVGNQ